MTKEDIQRALVDRLEDVARYLFPNGKKEGRNWKVGSIDGEPGTSFDINLRTGYWGDFSCTYRMDRNLINLWMGARRIDFKMAMTEIHSWLGAPPEVFQPTPESNNAPLSKKSHNESRPRWWASKLRLGSEEELAQVASDRNIAAEACRLAQSRSLLRFLIHREGLAWVVTDRRRSNALARLVGGRLWDNGKKNKMLSGSLGKLPIGVIEATHYQNIILVEGGPDLLACFHFMLGSGDEESIAPICMPMQQGELR
jgi:hypothetical protein